MGLRGPRVLGSGFYNMPNRCCLDLLLDCMFDEFNLYSVTSGMPRNSVLVRRVMKLFSAVDYRYE